MTTAEREPCSVISCDGYLIVYCTKQQDDGRTTKQYFHCNKCGHKPDNNIRTEKRRIMRPSRRTSFI